MFGKRKKTKYPTNKEWYGNLAKVRSFVAILGTEPVNDALWLLREHAIQNNKLSLVESNDATAKRHAFLQGYQQALADFEKLGTLPTDKKTQDKPSEWGHVALLPEQ